jgi:hypothetical protein
LRAIFVLPSPSLDFGLRREPDAVGSQTGRTRGGAKGFSNKEKKVKRRKQEYHSHRRPYDQGAERADPEQARARTMLALDRLGHQVLSNEPGGYDLEHWMRTLNSLLDDLLEKVGPENVPKEFASEREQALIGLAMVTRSPDFEIEMEALRREEQEARSALELGERKRAEKLTQLKERRLDLERELKGKREEFLELRKRSQSRGLFSRMIRSGPSIQQEEESIKTLEADLRALGEEIERSRHENGGDGAAERLQAQRKLEDVRARLSELQASRENSLQLSQQREAATQRLSALISSWTLPVPGQSASQVE